MSNQFKLLIKLDEGVELPEYAKEGDAGMDVRSIEENCVLKPGEHKLFKTGIKVALPDNVVAQVCSRSGLAYKNVIAVLNAPGIVDSCYRNDIGVILINLGKENFTIEKGDRIAQIVFLPFLTAVLIPVDELPESERGENGFGHTGVK